MTHPDDDAPPLPTVGDANAEPDVPAAPAMQADSALIVDVVKGGDPPENNAVVIQQDEGR